MDEREETAATAVTRVHNVIYTMPHDWAAITVFLGPVVDRIAESDPQLQVLVVTPDAEAAADVVAAAVRLSGTRALRLLAATSARRAGTLLRLEPSQLVAGPPGELLRLVGDSTLKLSSVRVVALAWVDELILHGAEAQLEALMADVPKDASRVIVTGALTDGVEGLAERYARRARVIKAPGAGQELPPTPIEYVSVSGHGRIPALRRLLDAVNPASAVVYTRSEDAERDARELLRAMGYGGASAAVHVGKTTSGDVDCAILYDVPASREELMEAIGPLPRRIIALAQPRQLETLRSVAAGVSLTPLNLSEAGDQARTREDVVRGELRDVLARETIGREVLALEPLLDEYDGIEIAAAVLHLLDRARSQPAASQSRTTQGPTARIFVNVGARDGAGPADLVGFVINQGGVDREHVGRVDVRDTFSLIEVPSRTAEDLSGRLTGSLLRGRRVVARPDEERPSRRAPAREGTERQPARGKPGTRPAHARGPRPPRPPDRTRRPDDR